jgi:hypothetical protein
MSLEASEQEVAAVANAAPRVTLADLEGQIAARYDITGEQAVGDSPKVDSLSVLSICILVVQNGYTIVGTSAPASAANFNRELGAKLAYEHAIRQLWPLEGYLLRSVLAADATWAANAEPAAPPA